MEDGAEEVKAAETGKKKNSLKRGSSDGEIKLKGEGSEGKMKVT